jgi:hypothetical protein
MKLKKLLTPLAVAGLLSAANDQSQKVKKSKNHPQKESP